MKTKTKQLSDEMSLVQEIKLIDQDLERIFQMENDLNKKKREIQSQLFFLKTGKKFGEMFTWNKKEYEIVSEKKIYLNLRCYDAPYLVEFLNGELKSPIKG